MANVILNDKHLTDIADAIRAKNGEATTYTPGAMAAAITNLPSGGGGSVEPIVLTDDCSYACQGDIASAYIKLYGNTISTNNVGDTKYMFYSYKNENIPFEINCNHGTYKDMSSMFTGASKLKEAPKINNAYPSGLYKFFLSCSDLTTIPEDFCDTWRFDRVRSYNYANCSQMFYGCHALRKIPTTLLRNMKGIQNSSSYSFYNTAFNSCMALDEIQGLGVDDITMSSSVKTSNCMSSMIASCYRLKDFTFAVNDDGTPKVVNWKSQSIDFDYVGYGSNALTYYNPYFENITPVTDDATYQALKDNPDYWTSDINYSRYNHDSAVNTINSLPDASAYIAANGGTNTLKFKGEAGAKTDGGAVNTLTEEEIAIAAAKGWTVTFA